MKISFFFIAAIITLLSCTTNKEARPTELPITGTWQLLTSTIIDKGDTIISDYRKNVSFIKKLFELIKKKALLGG